MLLEYSTDDIGVYCISLSPGLSDFIEQARMSTTRCLESIQKFRDTEVVKSNVIIEMTETLYTLNSKRIPSSIFFSMMIKI